MSTAVTYDKFIKAIRVKVPDSEEEFLLHPATVRRNDRSAQSVVCGDFFSQQCRKVLYGTIETCDEVLFIGIKFIMPLVT